MDNISRIIMSKKNILFIKNIYLGSNDKYLDYLDKYFNINLTWMNSTDLIDKDYLYLCQLTESYDIIILGGGPQHIIGNFMIAHPEINNQIELIKIISKTNKLLIGICLGCQIIGKAFGFEIIKMNKLCVGFNYLEPNSIDSHFITIKNDKYLSKLNYNLLSRSFSNHYDCIKICTDNPNLDNKLKCIGYSKLNIPYIFTHSEANIYGFQFHPEVTIECIPNTLNKYPNEQFELDGNKNISDIYLHFFDIFINS